MSTTTFADEPLRFRDPLLSAQARRRVLLRCQTEWDQRVADLVGKAGRVTHLTVVKGDGVLEYAVAQGQQIPYPQEFQKSLENARAWARRDCPRPPALPWG